MATDTTTNHTDATNNASTIHEGDVEQAHLTQAGAPVQVQVPQGENVVRVQVTPGETVELPFPTDGLVARLGDNGNLAVKVGDITVILVGYADATGQGDITIVGNDGKSVDVAAVLASTDPNLDIQTAAGPGAGDQGTGADNNGGVFTPFDPNAGLGGLNAIGGLDPTALQYGLLQRQFIEIIENDEVDTSPTLIGITGIRVVNEDDFGHAPIIEKPEVEVEAARSAFGISSSNDDVPSNGWSILDRLGDSGIPNPYCGSFGTHKDGNDPFDTEDHEEGSQTGGAYSDDSNGAAPGGIDQDREPLSTTAIIEAQFFADLPGKVTFDANGDGVDTGDTPIIQALEAKGLTSHGHELAYVLLPEVPESSPGANDGHGQMVVAYYLEDACNCYGGEQSIYEGGEGGGKVPVIVFTLSIDDDAANADELNAAGNSEIPLTFTIYGVVDHPTKGSGVSGEDILDIDTPFFLRDSDGSVTPVPGTELVFHDVDDVPQLGCVRYGCWNEIPYAIVDANLTIGHDESKGEQHTGYDSDLQNHPGPDQYTDDVGGWFGDYLINKADDQLDGIGHGVASGEDVSITYQQSILSQLSSEFLSHGNFHAQALGVAKSYIDVSFGADGKAKGNDQAGTTKFQHDNDTDTTTGTDGSKKNYDSDGNLIGNDNDATDKRAFELFMKDTSEGAPDGVIDNSKTNWQITVMIDGEPVVIDVYAYQLDANTIIGMATPPVLDGGSDNDGGQASRQAIALDDEGNPCLTGTGNAIPVFILRLDPDTGQVTFVQYHQINNPEGGNAASPDWDHSANDPIHLYDANGNPLVFFEATDFDGDTVQARLEVSVIDDAPDAKDDRAVLDEDTKGVDGDYNKVTGNLVLGVSNDGHNNDTGKDRLSVDHDHTISALKYGNSTITFDFDADTATVTGTDATNVTFDGHTVNFDTPYGHFSVVVDSDHDDPVAPGDTSLETDELGYYEYTSKPGNNSDKDHYGLETTANGTVDPTGATDADKISNILSKFNGITLTNNYDSNSNDAGDWGLKTIDAGGKHYTGIGVKSGLDNGETDTDGNGNVAKEVVTIGFPHDVDAAKITVGALFNGVLYDNGNAEALKWEAWDGNTKVGEGVVYGGYDGLVSFFINVGHDFDKVTLAPLDNGAGHNGNNSDFLLVGVTTCDELCVQEQLQYKLTDVDGDYDTAKLTIDVNDGVPCIAPRQADFEITIDEDGLPHGNNNNVNAPAGDGSDNVGGDNGPGDADGSEATAQGHIAYNTYADGLGTVFLSSTSSLTTLDGKSLTWAWDPSLNRLVGYATPDTDRIVVEVQLSNANDTGVDFKITLHEPLDHPQNSYEDNLYLDIKVTVTDKDCDIDTANIHVKIDDDVPTITSVPCSNLVTNGSFENVGQPDLGSGAWAVYSQIPGWKSGHEDNSSRAGLEIQNGTIVAASDGHNYLELDSDTLNGQAPASTNAYVYQNVQGTENDASYILKFDYQPRVHDQGTQTNNVEVWWGGVKIGTLSGDGTGWTTYTFVVPGDAGQTRLEFRAAGSADSLGGFIDNVWVSSCEVVDEDDLNDGSDSSKESLTVHGSTGVSFGADGAGGFAGLSLTQPLKSHGVNITIVAGPDGTFYGMAGNTKVFTVEFTKTGGEFDGNYKFTLNNEIDHPGGNNGENLYDLGINFTAKDKDGDGVNGTIHVTVVDDVPEAHITNRNGDSVRIDETPGLQDDDKSGNAPSAFSGLGSVLVWGTSSSAAVSQDPDYNADNPGTKVLSLHVSAPGVDSGIDIIDAGGTTRNVVLTEENGLVVGRVEGGVDAGKIVFAVGLGQDGKLTVAEYMAIAHPLGGSNNPDDSVQIANGALIAKLTVTDYDGDVASDTVAIGNQVKFDDDAPSVGSNADVWVEDDDLPNGVDGGPGDNTAPVNVTGTLSHNYGTDGAGSTLLSGVNLPSGQGFTSALSNGDKTLTISQNGTPVLKIELSDATGGNYTVTQLAAIKHTHDNTNNGNYENETAFTVSYKVTDEDGDTQTGSLKINVDDDSPTAYDDGLYVVDHFGGAPLTGNVLTNDAVGADQPGTVVGIRLGGENGSYVNVPVGGVDININAAGGVGTPAIGTLHINPNGSWTFTQTTSSTLPDLTFSYKMSDSDGDTDTASFKIDLKNAPPPTFEDENALVDEDGIPGKGANPNTTTGQGNGDDVGGHVNGGQPNPASEAIFRNTLGNGFNWNGATGTIVFTFTNAQLAALKFLDGTTATMANVEGNGTSHVVIWDGVPNAQGSTKILDIVVTDAATAEYQVTLLGAVKHPGHDDPSTVGTIETAFEDNISLPVTVTATGEGGATSHTLTIGIDDDMPTARTTSEGSIFASVDESNLAVDVSPTDLSVLFSTNVGADGGTVAYSLTGLNGQPVVDGTPTGLVDTLTNSAVLLYNVGGNIVGKTAGGDVVFILTLNGSVASFDQQRAIVHDDPSTQAEAKAFTGLVTITATVTDGDGDKVSVTHPGSFTVNMYDDAPDAVDDSNSVSTIGIAITGNVTNNDSSGADVKAGFAKGEVTKFTIDNVDYAADGAPHAIPGHGTMSMDSHGNYSFTQTDGAAGTMNVTYTLRDGDGDTDTATLAITTKADLQPINYNDADAGNENPSQQNNVMIILDRSGSMSDDIDPNTPGTQTRLSIAIAAIQNLLNTYDQIGDVKVMVVQFSSDGQRMDFWGTPQQALDYINSNSPSGSYTSYSDALSFGAAGLGDNDGKIPGAPTTVYFLSDGVPTADGANSGTGNNQDHSLTTSQQTAWNNALEGNNVTKVYAVGVGPGLSANDGDLADVANPNGNANNTPAGEVVIVTDENGLSAELLDTINVSTIEGNVLDGSHTSGIGDNGSDAANTPDAAGNGATHIYTFSHNGNGTAFDVEFSWDGVAGSVSQVGAGGTNVQIAGKVVSFDTEFGRMEFNFQTGAYEFTPGSVGQTQNVTFHYGTKDSDGDVDVGGGVDGDGAAGGADLVITINNVNQAPEITSNGGGASAAINVAENSTFVTTVTATDPDGDAKTYSIVGGADAAKFTIDPTTGVLSFISAPNFENPTDNGGNNVYDVQVKVSDGTLTDVQSIAVTVTNVNEFAPVISSNGGGNNAAINVAENTTAVTTVVAADADAGSTITYSIVGGADQAKFTINPVTGALSFITAPNFEAPTDAGANNVYDVIVRASDGTLTDQQTIAVTVTDVNENTAPSIGQDRIITNETGVVTVQDSWLLRNDTDAENNVLTITAASTSDGLNFDTTPSHAGSAITFDLDTVNSGGGDTYLTDGETTSLTYTLSDGSLTDNSPSAIITYESSNTLTGTANDEIIIGNSGNDTITGNGGIDILIGGGGNDTLVFDAADHLVDGGTGFDRVQTTASTFAFDEVGAGAKFANIEMIDLGDSNHNANRTVTINAADVLSSTNVTVDTHAGSGTSNQDIDLFVIGDNTNGTRDNVTLNGFTKVVDVDSISSGNQGTFDYTDPATGISHTYQLYQNTALGVKVAVEDGLDITVTP